MEFSKVISERRSIRKYDATKKVTREQIEEMVKAAQCAPSWKNQQTSKYYVALSEEKLNEVRAALPSYNQKNTAGAAAYIVTTFVPNNVGFADGNPINEPGNGWGYYDLGLQNMNLLNKAYELGLGTLVMGLRDAKGLRKALNIPANELIVAVLGVGYADIAPQAPKRKELDEILSVQ